MNNNFNSKIILFFKKSILKIFILYLFIALFSIDNKSKLIQKQNKKKNDNRFFENRNFTNPKIKNSTPNNEKFISNYSFRALYISNFENETVQVINEIYEKYIEKLFIDNEPKTPYSYYTFSQRGLHEIIALFDIEKINSFAYMFYNIPQLVYIDFKIFLVDNLESMERMFKNCINLKVISFKSNNFNNIINLSEMFLNCYSLTSLELPNYDSPQLNNISYMLGNCSSLKSINFHDLNTINLKDMSGLFYGCSSLTSIDLSNFRTSNVINIQYMFSGCLSLTSINIEFFEINKVNNIIYLFRNCSNLKFVSLPNLNENQMKYIFNIFIGCNNLLFKNIITAENRTPKSNDICIIGLWYGCNYGSMLTYYALHEVIKNMGYSILMINDPLEDDNIIYFKTHPKVLVSSFYRISEKKKLDNTIDFNKECKCFLVGSDQLWNIDLSRNLGQFYFLGFVDNETKKISYGTSFGRKYEGTEEEKNITKANLKRFDGISVRDELSLNISKEIFGIKNVVQVCDPTLLLDSSDYMNLINKANIQKKDEYFLAYILDPNPEIGFRLEKLSKDRNIKIFIILDHPTDIKIENIKNFSLKGKGNVEIKEINYIKDWLWYFYNSKNVLTDSYHGTLFSIIFRKPFITLKNNKRGGERFISLLKSLNLMDRLFETPECINDKDYLYDKIDYKIALKKLSKIKEFSYNWLKTKLGTCINKKHS